MLWIFASRAGNGRFRLRLPLFDVPVPSPPVLPGALLIVAMTPGYSATDRAITRKTQLSRTAHLGGGQWND
ncbi:MAG: XapX domain-containing protein [Bryobacteraceae bacterium]|nr:XapX domain-containing protein [Bryobacteraceae bacterium]